MIVVVKRRNKLVSIIVPVYNSKNTLEQCLQAIRSSIYDNTEIIVVDDGSQDNSLKIAKKYADRIVALKKNIGRNKARLKGFLSAKGDIIVNIDSDVVMNNDSIQILVNSFKNNSEIAALTGKLAKEIPYTNFASTYKNLYMHYYFQRLPDNVNFLYGSIFAFRSNVLKILNKSPFVEIADDTELGQELINQGKKIMLVKDVQVKHLKKFTLISLIKNDFRIPYEWANIFLKHKGWKQLGKNKTGYAHAGKEQIASIFLILALFLILVTTYNLNYLVVVIIVWLLLNFTFFRFLYKEKGVIYTLKAVAYTFLDHIIMTLGIVSGTLTYTFNNLKRKIL